MDINNITFTKPTNTTFSDACEHGLWGYCTNGIAWRYALPKHMIGQFSINLLEFLAAMIKILIVLRNTEEGKAKILASIDSSSALGWLFKTSFASNQPNHDMVARRLAEELIDKNSTLYSQHIEGCFNFVADSLSRDNHILTGKLTFALRLLLLK